MSIDYWQIDNWQLKPSVFSSFRLLLPLRWNHNCFISLTLFRHSLDICKNTDSQGTVWTGIAHTYSSRLGWSNPAVFQSKVLLLYMLCGPSDAHIILQYVDHAYLLPAFVLTVCRDDERTERRFSNLNVKPSSEVWNVTLRSDHSEKCELHLLSLPDSHT